MPLVTDPTDFTGIADKTDNAPVSDHGSLDVPVVLMKTDDNRPYKRIENDHVVIIRNNEKYSITGKKL